MPTKKQLRDALDFLGLTERYGGDRSKAFRAVRAEPEGLVCERAKDEAARVKEWRDAKIRRLQAKHARAWKVLCEALTKA